MINGFAGVSPGPFGNDKVIYFEGTRPKTNLYTEDKHISTLDQVRDIFAAFKNYNAVEFGFEIHKEFLALIDPQKACMLQNPNLSACSFDNKIIVTGHNNIGKRDMVFFNGNVDTDKKESDDDTLMASTRDLLNYTMKSLTRFNLTCAEVSCEVEGVKYFVKVTK